MSRQSRKLVSAAGNARKIVICQNKVCVFILSIRKIQVVENSNVGKHKKWWVRKSTVHYCIDFGGSCDFNFSRTRIKKSL